MLPCRAISTYLASSRPISTVLEFPFSKGVVSFAVGSLPFALSKLSVAVASLPRPAETQKPAVGYRKLRKATDAKINVFQNRLLLPFASQAGLKVNKDKSR